MTDLEWNALAPYILWHGAGRPVANLRARIDGMFWIAATGKPWKDLPKTHGTPDTVSRHFRRLTQRHLWQRLLHALADPKVPAALKSLEPWICRACHRAVRLAGMSLITTARRLGFFSALRGPSWMVPDLDLSETIRRVTDYWLDRVLRDRASVPRGIFALCGRLLATAGGRRYVPRCLWPA
ncbi:putative transposase of IS4/5 family DUF4096 [Humitalea rosea]|uniref:Putative transposase of IS4/5 family DUF4096 n=1 Tax=Humitalea rosea TaxID=990373 RepID=A0A2W7IGI3_9PROT|nr:transposase [Humitalea rosea]PZW45092.1 putative transposase of IS4/5 family DUF4096 [Humitalea rosea]